MVKKEIEEQEWRKLTPSEVKMMLEPYNEQVEGLGKRAKKLVASLIYIYRHSDTEKSGVLYASHDTIRNVAGIRKNDLNIVIDELINKGVINYSRGKKGKSGVASSFSFTFDVKGIKTGNDTNKISDDTNKNQNDTNKTGNDTNKKIENDTNYDTNSMNTGVSEDFQGTNDTTIQYNTIYNKTIQDNTSKNNILQENSMKDNLEKINKEILNNLYSIFLNKLYKDFFNKFYKDFSEKLFNDISEKITSKSSSFFNFSENIGKENSTSIDSVNIGMLIDEKLEVFQENFTNEIKEILQFKFFELYEDLNKIQGKSNSDYDLSEDRENCVEKETSAEGNHNSSKYNFSSYAEFYKARTTTSLNSDYFSDSDWEYFARFNKGETPAYPDIPDNTLVVQEPVGIATDLSRVACL